MKLTRLVACCAAAGILVACGGGSTSEEGGPETRNASDPGDMLLDDWAAEADSSDVPLVEPLTEAEKLQIRMNRAAEINRKSLEAALTASEQSSTAKSATVAVPKAHDRTAVYRFWNPTTRAHFYTIGVSERDHVIATNRSFNYEGVAFHVDASFEPGMDPVHRYYNISTGVHFYTISQEEKAYIDAELPQMQYEGIAYYASRVPGPGLSALYRFFHRASGFHFYTAGVAERNQVNDSLCDYYYEGVAYYVLQEPPATPPPAPTRNRVVLLVGDSLSEAYTPGMNMQRYRFVSPGQMWSDQLSRSFGQRTGRACDRIVNVSVGGRRTNHGLAGMPDWLALHKPTHVVVAQGTNDAWGSIPLVTIESNLNQMVSLARNAGAKPYVMEFPFLRSGASYRQNLSAVYQRAGSANQASYILATGGVSQTESNYHTDLVHLKNAAQPRVMENAWQGMRSDF